MKNITGIKLIEALTQYKENTLLSKRELEQINKGIERIDENLEYVKDFEGNWVETSNKGKINTPKSIKPIV